MFYDKFFGGSPTDFQFILWAFTIFGTAIIKLFNMIYGINREVGEIKTELKVGVRGGFNKIKEDIKKLSDNVQEIKSLVKKRK